MKDFRHGEKSDFGFVYTKARHIKDTTSNLSGYSKPFVKLWDRWMEACVKFGNHTNFSKKSYQFQDFDEKYQIKFELQNSLIISL